MRVFDIAMSQSDNEGWIRSATLTRNNRVDSAKHRYLYMASAGAAEKYHIYHAHRSSVSVRGAQSRERSGHDELQTQATVDES